MTEKEIPHQQPSMFQEDNVTPSNEALPPRTLKSDLLIEQLGIRDSSPMTDTERSQWQTYEGLCNRLLEIGNVFNLNRIFDSSVVPDYAAGLITPIQYEALKALRDRRLAELRPPYDPSSPLDNMIPVPEGADWRARQMKDA